MTSTASPAPSAVKRFGPIALIALTMIAVFASGAHRYVSLDAISENYQNLRALVAERPLVSGIAFVAVYAIAVTISLPGALWFTIASGLLFGWALGAFYSWAGALTGATLIFLAARSAFRDMLRTKAGSTLDQLKDGFEGDAFFYLLLLRLVPLPFFAINVAAGLFNVRVRDYVAATAIGIIPAGVAYASIGAGAGEVIAAGEDLSLSVFTDPKIVLGVAGLATLTVIGLWLKRRRAAPSGVESPT